MKIYDFYYQDKLEGIKEKHQYVKIIKDKIAEKRSEFRSFSTQIELESKILFDCLSRYETTLLIDCYTYAEQITKALIYQLLEKDNNENVFIERFILKKLDPEKFSPNVNFNGISSILNEVYKNFKFILTDINEINVYDELIKSRHRYAHKGDYDYDFNNYSETIDMLEYISYEFKLIQNPEFNRAKFISDYNNIKIDCNKLIKNNHRNDLGDRKNELISSYNSLDKSMLTDNKLLLRELENIERKLATI